ncbi:uncharacterized protein LOC114579018 [Dendrobium catenatum]|uniref:uncharacterized protein LOC114579018 n=1 Tax=Dendrobium catenatum TaxID=906689 RepID=UPI0010A09419|nr:uncharacterized protein LOC114579018 [Dendrobium catenatum]
MSFSSIARPVQLNAPSVRTGGRRRRVAKPKNCRRNGRLRRRLSDSKAILRRLQALKDLIPSIRNRTAGDEVALPQPVNADRIFEDAAGYILRLKTQVEILRHLVDFYSPKEGDAEVVL